jgi:hypothetical protein
MKTLFPKILGFLVVVMITSSSQAQESTGPLPRGEFGVRYMPTFSALDIRTYNGERAKYDLSVSHGVGIMAAGDFGKYMSIQVEANYYQSSQKYTDRNLVNEVNVGFLNIPFLLSISTDKSRSVIFNAVAGPQIGITVGTNIKTTGTESADSLKPIAAVKSMDVGFAYGAGVGILLNHAHSCRLDIGYRGFYGLVDINDDSTRKGTYNVLLTSSRKTNGAYLGITFLF